jgi:hypothetical protein
MLGYTTKLLNTKCNGMNGQWGKGIMDAWTTQLITFSSEMSMSRSTGWGEGHADGKVHRRTFHFLSSAVILH